VQVHFIVVSQARPTLRREKKRVWSISYRNWFHWVQEFLVEVIGQVGGNQSMQLLTVQDQTTKGA